MKKNLLIGSGAVLLIAAIAFGTFFAHPPLASARSNAPANSATSTATNPYCEQYLHDLANRLHVSVTTLEQSQRSAFDDMLNRLVRDGQLTQSQATGIRQHMQSHQVCTGNWNAKILALAAWQFMSKYHGQIENSIASGLHMTGAQLTEQLRSGRSLSQIAAMQHVSNPQLHTIVLTSIQSALTAAVSKGDLTQSQSTTFSQFLQNHPAFVNYILNAQWKNMNTGMQGGMQDMPSCMQEGMSCMPPSTMNLG